MTKLTGTVVWIWVGSHEPCEPKKTPAGFQAVWLGVPDKDFFWLESIVSGNTCIFLRYDSDIDKYGSASIYFTVPAHRYVWLKDLEYTLLMY